MAPPRFVEEGGSGPTPPGSSSSGGVPGDEGPAGEDGIPGGGSTLLGPPVVVTKVGPGGPPGDDGQAGEDGIPGGGSTLLGPAVVVVGPGGAPGDDGQAGEDGIPGGGSTLLGPVVVVVGPGGAPGDDGQAGEDGIPGGGSTLLGPAVAVLGPAGAPGDDGAPGDEGTPATAGALQGPNIASPRGVTLLAQGGLFGSTAVPQITVVQGTNFPVGSLAFDVATTDTAYWSFPLRAYNGGAITVTIYWYAAAVTNAVKWEVALGCITVGTDTGSIEAKAFAAATSVQTTVAANTKAGSTTVIQITGASLDSASADDVCVLRLKRIAASAEMAGSALLWPYMVVSWQ